MENIDSELTCPYGVSCKQPPGKQFMDKQLIRSLLTPDKLNILNEIAIRNIKIYSCPKHPNKQFQFAKKERYQRVTCCPNIRICNSCFEEVHEGTNCAYTKLRNHLLMNNGEKMPQGEKFPENWKLEAQSCPYCGIVCVKNEKCEHVKCMRC